MKANPSRGKPGPSAAACGLPFLCTGKMLPFFQAENEKSPIGLEISLQVKMSQSQRHSPGTIPAVKGSLHLPFYKKGKKQTNSKSSFQYFPQEQPNKAGSFQLQVISNNNINNTGFCSIPRVLYREVPLRRHSGIKSLPFPLRLAPCQGGWGLGVRAEGSTPLGKHSPDHEHICQNIPGCHLLPTPAPRLISFFFFFSGD